MDLMPWMRQHGDAARRRGDGAVRRVRGPGLRVPAALSRRRWVAAGALPWPPPTITI